jgi:hypothetical protein
LGQRADSGDRATENGRGDEENEEEVVARPASSRNGHKPSSKRTSTKESVNIEDEEIPF